MVTKAKTVKKAVKKQTVKKSVKKPAAKKATVKNEKIIEQGDIVLIHESLLAPEAFKAKKSDAEVKLIENGLITRSQVTGHAHTLVGAALYQQDDILFAEVTGKFKLTHDEHADTVANKPLLGKWLIRNVIEVDPFTDEKRAVID